MTPPNTFTITAAPDTDIWRKPPTTDVFNAPTATPPHPSTLRTKGPLLSFLSARLSFSFAWQEQYDQGGLLLSLRRTTTSSNNSAPPKWIKTGIEFYNGSPRLSTVGCDNWADWSVAPLEQQQQQQHGDGDGNKQWTTVQIEKDNDVNGTGIWVYQVLEGGEKVPLREIAWVFGDKPEEWEVEVQAMAARPAKGVQGDLVVEFGGMEVNWTD